jgi:HSP20 family protein
VLYLRGEKEREETVEEDGYTRTERYYGHFSRTVPLPDDVDADAAEAALEGGMLTLRLPKRRRRATEIEA